MRSLHAVLCLLAVSISPVGAANFLGHGYGPANRGYTPEKLTLPLTLVWRFVTAPRQHSGVTPLVVDKDIFYAAGPPGGFSGEKSGLYCLDVETGAAKWIIPTEQPARSVPAYSSGLIWFGDDEGILRAVDPAKQETVWQLDLGHAIRTPIVASGELIFFGTSGRGLYAVDTQKREKVWFFRPRDDVYAPPAVDGRTVYVACVDRTLYAIDARTGMERWSRLLPGRSALFSGPVIGSRYIYIASGNMLVALGKYGQHVWTQQFKGDLAGHPALADGVLYVAMRGVGTGAVYALDEYTGGVKWRFPRDPAGVSPVSPTAAPAVADGMVLVGCSYGVTYVLSAQDGQPLWRYMARRPVDPSGPGLRYAASSHAVVANGSLYMTYDDGTLCRFAHAAPDIAGPSVTNMTPKPGSLTNGRPPFTLGANIYDEGSGVEPSSVQVLLDGKPVPCRLRLSNSDCFYTFTTADLSEPMPDGWHTVTVTAADYVGNKVEKSWRFLWDRNYTEERPPEQVTPYTPGVTPYYEEEEEY